MTDTITLKPPSRDLFAAVQVETSDGTIIGTAPAFRVDGNPPVMIPLPVVPVAVKPGVPAIARWVHEDSTLGQKLITIRRGRR